MVAFFMEEILEAVRVGAFDFLSNGSVEIPRLALLGYLLAVMVVSVIIGVFVLIVFVLLSLFLFVLDCGCGRFFVALVFE